MSELRGLRPHQTVGYEWVPPNLLSNGGFEIWQRGAGPLVRTGPGTRGFLPDEWEVINSVGSGPGQSITVSRSSSAKIGTYCAQLDFVYDGGLVLFDQSFEFYQSLAGLPLTFSCWIKCNTPNRVGIVIGNNLAAGSAGHSGSGDWERVTATCTLTNAVFPLVGAWPHSYGVVAAVTLGAGNVSGVLVDGATVVVGLYPEGIPFIPPNPAEDKQHCQRFYEPLYINMSANATAGDGNTWYGCVPMVPKASMPTVTPIGTVINGNATGLTVTNTTKIIHYAMSRSGAAGYGGVTSTLVAEVS